MDNIFPKGTVIVKVTDVTGHRWYLPVIGSEDRPIEELLDRINASVEEWVRDR